MPTVSCVNHIAGHSGGHKFVGSGDSSVVDNGIEYVDANGQLHPGAVDVIFLHCHKASGGSSMHRPRHCAGSRRCGA